MVHLLVATVANTSISASLHDTSAIGATEHSGARIVLYTSKDSSIRLVKSVNKPESGAILES